MTLDITALSNEELFSSWDRLKVSKPNNLELPNLCFVDKENDQLIMHYAVSLCKSIPVHLYIVLLKELYHMNSLKT